jgi:hypothetical protein
LADSSQSEKGSNLLALALQGNETAATALAALYGQEGREFAEGLAIRGLGPIGLAASAAYGAATGGTSGAIAEGGGFAAGVAAGEAVAGALAPVAVWELRSHFTQSPVSLAPVWPVARHGPPGAAIWSRKVADESGRPLVSPTRRGRCARRRTARRSDRRRLPRCVAWLGQPGAQFL